MRLIALLFFILFTNNIFANSIFIKLAVNPTSYITLTFNNVDEISFTDSRIKFIAKSIREPFLDLNSISRDYYNISIKDGFKQDNKVLKQIEMVPINKDRFPQIINMYGNLIVRREVYDNNNKLLYSYGYTEKIPDMQPTKRDLKEISLEKEQIYYKGFQGKLIKKLEDGTIHYIFNDGLNKFSLFVKKTDQEIQINKTILYGNYVLSKKIDGIQYTVIGTIPFEEMENFITYITVKDKK
ncbi:MAG: MucB/RseB C-terminal domain-containing protein [Calditerrivibrio sp.]|nr:MucB/RseB C-terminal domain-containing protein [Calditerrivibrio sp.]